MGKRRRIGGTTTVTGKADKARLKMNYSITELHVSQSVQVMVGEILYNEGD